jgi:hypothetical protein
MQDTSTKTVTVTWKDVEDGSADISFDTNMDGNGAAKVLLGGLLAALGIEDHEQVADVVRVLNKYTGKSKEMKTND